MTLSDRLRPWARRLPALAARGVGALSAVTLLYVGYSHFASLRGRDYNVGSYSETLDSDRALARFTVIDGPGLHHEIKDGALHVSGTAEPGVASWIVGPAQYLDDVVVASIRFVSPMKGADVVVGFERADDPPGGKNSRRLLFSTHAEGEGAAYSIEGDNDAFDARRLTTATSPDSEGFKPTPESAPVRSAELRLSSYLDRAIGTVSNAAVVATKMHWPMGTRVRLVFGVIVSKAGTPVDVAFQKAGYEQQERPLSLTPFNDRFNAKYIDPRRWSVLLGDADDAEVNYALDETGLHIRARSKNHTGRQTAFALLSSPTPLRTFTYSNEWRVHKLKGAAIVGGLTGIGYSLPRFGDFGFREENGKITVIGVGHLDGKGLVGVHGITAPDANGRITIHYDASTSQIDARLGLFREISNGKFDLFPGENVHFRVLVNLENPDSEVDVSLREVSFE